MRLPWGGSFSSCYAGFDDLTRSKACYNRVLEMFRSLEAWKIVWITRQLLWNFVGLDNYDMYRRGFVCPDFINPQSCQAAKLPSFYKSLTAFTMADRLSRTYTFGYKLAFTMAEILISLTIIGIIAAITLPALQVNINEKTWATKRKALYSRMSQAIALMPSLNGYGVVFNEQGEIDEAQTAQKATQAFISDGLSKVLTINNICDGSTVEGLKKCGFPDKFTKMGINSKMDAPITIVQLNKYFNISDYSQINTNSAAFETVNGESVLTYYNPNCSFDYKDFMQPTMCANFIFDLNGRKGPNKVGKDIGFITAFYPSDSEVVMPYPVKYLSVSNDGNHSQYSIGYGNQRCREKFGHNTKMANIEELKSIWVNNSLGFSYASAPTFLPPLRICSSTVSNGMMYNIGGSLGNIYQQNVTDYTHVESVNSDFNTIFCIN